MGKTPDGKRDGYVDANGVEWVTDGPDPFTGSPIPRDPALRKVLGFTGTGVNNVLDPEKQADLIRRYQSGETLPDRSEGQGQKDVGGGVKVNNSAPVTNPAYTGAGNRGGTSGGGTTGSSNMSTSGLNLGIQNLASDLLTGKANPKDGSFLKNLLIHANTPNRALDPSSNPWLGQSGTNAENLANGSTSWSAGRGAANDAIGAADLAGRGISTADTGSALAQNEGNAQFGQDLGQTRQDSSIYRDAAMGKGPSAAALLGQQMLDRNIRAQAAMAASARGGNVASAMRQASMSGSQIGLQGAQQIAAQRAQEQLNAMGQLNQSNATLQQGDATFGQQTYHTREQDLQKAGMLAANAGDTANRTMQMYGQNLGGLAAGNAQLAGAAGAWQAGQGQVADDKRASEMNYINSILQMYNLGAGNAAQNASTAANLSIANRQQDTNLAGAAIGAGAALGSGLISAYGKGGGGGGGSTGTLGLGY